MSFNFFAQAHGLIIKDLRTDGKIHRCGTTNRPRSTNGAYSFDGERGWVFAWDAEAQVQWYEDPNARPWTEAEKQDFRRKQQDEWKAKREKQRQAAQLAAQIIEGCTVMPHPYLESKGFRELSGFVSDGVLHIPMRNWKTGALQTLQKISLTSTGFEKKMLYGGAASGAVLVLGERVASHAIFCEGYATGLSIQAAVRKLNLRACVVVCFSAKNLKAVAMEWPGERSVFADHDREDRMGRRAGQEAAQETGLRWVMSDVEGNDANDIHVKQGIFALCAKVLELIRK